MWKTIIKALVSLGLCCYLFSLLFILFPFNNIVGSFSKENIEN